MPFFCIFYLYFFHSYTNLLFHIKQHASDDVEKMILGNKCDMQDKRVVSKEKGETIAMEHGIRFLETSAKANTNIEKAFIDLASSILSKQMINQTAERNEKITVSKPDSKPTISKCCN